MKPELTLFVAAAATAVALAVAGCGGSTSGSAPSAPATDAGGAAKVAAVDSSLGRIVVDNGGLTLYTFAKDMNGRSACSGQCVTYWPPLLTNGEPAARAGVARTLLGTTRRRDGGEQVTYAGRPLYRYVGDSKPGQTNGEGSEEFGGEWDAVSPAGKTVEPGD
jgi:predicted lipoprotein with Yx(FWY)xxD motif